MKKKCGYAKRLMVWVVMLLVSGQSLPVLAVTDGQKDAISDHCSSIIDNLKKVQREDSRTRVYLGAYYEIILTKFIMPLNVRLVENNLSSAGLVENQNRFAEAKTTFAGDFVSYQKALEELIAMDCKNEPEKFYDKLGGVRQKRKIMSQDTLKLRSLISEHIKLVNELEGKV